MPEESKFHLTVVTQKRRAQSDPSQGPAAGETKSQTRESGPGGRGGESGSPGEHGRSGGERHPGRHYRDYGTVDLGSLDSRPPAEEIPAPIAAEPSKGAVQREFYDKYDQVLSRRYAKHGRSWSVRVLVIALLTAFLALTVWIGISTLGGQNTETLPKPDVETNPVATLDLG